MRATVLVSGSNESVTALNNRARTDLTLDGIIQGLREEEQHDGTNAASGDIVIHAPQRPPPPSRARLGAQRGFLERRRC